MLLFGHLDTVPVGTSWTKGPFAAKIENGKMFGRSTCDMKAGLAAIMIAFRDAAKLGKKPTHSLVMIASVDEEGEIMHRSSPTGYTDSAVMAAETGCIDCMSYGPADGNAHQNDEYIL